MSAHNLDAGQATATSGSGFRLANEAWEKLFRAQATVARELADDGIWAEVAPSEYGVLHALSRSAIGLRISELQADVLLTQPGVSRLVGRLEDRGLVTRCVDPEDARASRIQLTPSGTALQRRVGVRHSSNVAHSMTRALNREQLAQLRDLCSILIQSATEDGHTTT